MGVVRACDAPRGDVKTVQSEEGAALVEFAIAAILIFTLLFGIMEAAWGFFNLLEVRHSANEGARLAAVNIDPDTPTCDSMRDGSFSNPPMVTVSYADTNGSGVADIGDEITVQLDAVHDGLTGFISAFATIPMSQKETYRIEQNITAVTFDASTCALPWP